MIGEANKKPLPCGRGFSFILVRWFADHAIAIATAGASPGTQMEDPPRPSLNREGERLEAADNTEGGEQGRESGNNHLDDCLDDVLFHNLRLKVKG